MNSPNSPEFEPAAKVDLPFHPSVDPYFSDAGAHVSGPVTESTKNRSTKQESTETIANSGAPATEDSPQANLRLASLDFAGLSLSGLNSPAEPPVDVRTPLLNDDLQSKVQPMPIRGALSDELIRRAPAVAGQDLSTANQVPATPDATSVPVEVTEPYVTMQNRVEAIGELIQQDAEGKFLATPGSVVEIDGNQGYDYIDLSNRDVSSVAFVAGSLVVSDAAMEEPFTIRYRNVSQALFANGHMIDLP